jgi:hypothetical protein
MLLKVGLFLDGIKSPGDEEKTLKEYLRQEFGIYWIDDLDFQPIRSDKDKTETLKAETIGVCNVHKVEVTRKDGEEKAVLNIDGKNVQKFDVIRKHNYVEDIFEPYITLFELWFWRTTNTEDTIDEKFHLYLPRYATQKQWHVAWYGLL